MADVLVTGATGKVGRELVAGLVHDGRSVRALARDPAKADLPDGVDVVAGDIRDPAAVDDHARGVDAAFVLWPFMDADGVDAVTRALGRRVRRIVVLSAEAAAHRPDSFWASIERATERTAREWTFLRPTGFAANTLMWADQIRETRVVRWVYGEAARSLIDERDIAAVAARALTEDRHAGATYVLTGPEALTQIEQVHRIGEAIGRDVRWQEIAREDVQHQLGGVPDTALETWASFVADPEVVTSTVEQVTGRPASTFRAWARRHADRFR
ncbi:MAG TPA: NAD(P)H-binding protein [Gaiellales bacterium]